MNAKRYHFIEIMIWVGIPFLFMIIDWFYIHVLNSKRQFIIIE